MSFWKSDKIESTRKAHKCEYCNAIIPIGSSCNKEVGTYEGEFNSYYLCNRCVYFLDNFVNREDTLGFFADDLFYTNILVCPKCIGYKHKSTELYNNSKTIKLECGNCSHIWDVDLGIESLRRYKNRR